MSIYLYDEAIVNKLNKWGLNNTATVLSPDDVQNTFRIINDKNEDAGVQLPLITISRNGSFDVKITAKRPLSYDGLHIARGSDGKYATLNAIPIELSYQIDIYTRYRREADEYARELTFCLVNYPELTIELPYEDMHYKHNATLLIDGNITDNSGVSERLVHGQFTRYTMKFKVSNAYLFDIRIKQAKQIEGWSVKPEKCTEELILFEDIVHSDSNEEDDN